MAFACHIFRLKFHTYFSFLLCMPHTYLFHQTVTGQGPSFSLEPWSQDKLLFDIHTAVHRNIFLYPNQPDAPIYQIILFWTDTLHVSDCLSVHHQEFKTVYTAKGICLLPYVRSWTPDDGRKDSAKHVEYQFKIKLFDIMVHLVGLATEIFSTSFGLSFRPSSGGQDCTYSKMHMPSR